MLLARVRLYHRTQLGRNTGNDAGEVFVLIARRAHEELEHRDHLIASQHRNPQACAESGLHRRAGARKISIAGHVVHPHRFF